MMGGYFIGILGVDVCRVPKSASDGFDQRSLLDERPRDSLRKEFAELTVEQVAGKLRIGVRDTAQKLIAADPGQNAAKAPLPDLILKAPLAHDRLAV